MKTVFHMSHPSTIQYRLCCLALLSPIIECDFILSKITFIQVCVMRVTGSKPPIAFIIILTQIIINRTYSVGCWNFKFWQTLRSYQDGYCDSVQS